MEIAVVIFLFLVGVVFIVKGGDWFVDAASWIAQVSGIPKLIVGATIVSLATTLPEMLVSVMAAAEGKVDMSIGNAVGSVTANIGLIMAISVLFMPGAAKRGDYLKKSVLMLLAAVLVVVSGYMGSVNLFMSLVLIVVFAVFMTDNVLGAKRAVALSRTDSTREISRPRPERREIIINIVKFVVGTVGIVWGADLLVDNGSELARFIGVSERIIGVTVIAVGTSLPELVTTLTAIAKKESSLSLGNILGANIIDLTLILPLSALVSGKALPVAPASAMLDLPACLLVGAVALVPTMFTQKLSRVQGVLLLGIYIVYMALTCVVLGT